MKEQLYIFLVCICCGIAGGVIYDVFEYAQAPFRSRVLKTISELFFCVVFTAFYLVISVRLALPNFRIYMFCGCAAGFFLYLKSFHKTVDFLLKRVYNGIKKRIPKKKGAKRCGKFTFRKKKREESR